MSIIVNECKYTLRKTLGNYNHEELSASASSDPQNPASGDELMLAVKKICTDHVTRTNGAPTTFNNNKGTVKTGAQKRSTMTPKRVQQQQKGRLTPEQILSLPYSIKIDVDWKDRESLDVIQKTAKYQYVQKANGGDGCWHGSSYPTVLEEVGIPFDIVEAPSDAASSNEDSEDTDDIPF